MVRASHTTGSAIASVRAGRPDWQLCQTCNSPLHSQTSKKFAVFDLEHGPVPEPNDRPLRIWKSHLGSPSKAPAKQRTNPIVFPGQARDFKSPTEFPGQLLRTPDDVGPFRVEVHHPVSHIRHTRCSDPRTIVQRA